MGAEIRNVGAVRWALLAGVASVVLAGCSGGDTVADPAADGASASPAPQHAEFDASHYGVYVGIKVGFDEVRTVTGATLSWQGDTEEIALYPDDGTDPDTAPEEIRVEPGQRPTYEETILTACPVIDPELPVLEIFSTVDGQERTDRYVPDDRAALEGAFGQWCERGVSVNASGWSIDLTGQVTATVEIANPGPDPVEIVSERVETTDTTWERATVEALPGVHTELVITGQGPDDQCPSSPGPWDTGHILGDGVRLPPPDGSASFC